MNDIKVIFMGTPDFSVPILQSLVDNYNVIAVVTQPDKEIGRHKELSFSPIKKLALNYNIKVIQPVRVRKEYESITALNPDIIITCAYGQIIPKELLDCPPLGCINVHASLLPKLRGGAPIHRAIMDGLSETGITIMYMDEHMDTGDMIENNSIEITNTMTTGELHDKLSTMGAELLIKTLPSIIDGTNKRVKQNEEEATLAKLIKREDELIDFSKETKIVYNQIRGLNPFPGAYTTIDNKVMKVYSSRIGNSNKGINIGEIISIYNDGIGIKTLDGEIILTIIKPEGKKQILVKDYLNGIDKNKLIGKILGSE